MSEQDCRKNLWLINIYTLAINAVFLLPVIMPYYRDELGLSFHDFLIGESVFAAVMILGDIPTGFIADKLGRKIALLLGTVFAFLGYGLLYAATGFWSAVLSQGVIGIAVCLASGANSAFLYDTLLTQGRENEFRRREGLRFGLQLYGVAGACLIGGYAYTLGHYLPLQLELGAVFAAFLATLFMTEPARHKSATDKHPLKDVWDTTLYALHGHKQVAEIILLMMLVFSTTKIVMWSIQSYAGFLGYSESLLGFIYAAVMLSGALGGHFGHKVFPNLKGLDLLKTLLAVFIVILLAAGFSGSLAGLLVLSLEGVLFGFGMPRAQEAINRLVGSERRATVLSAANLAISCAFIPFSQSLGWLADEKGILDALLGHAILLAVLGAGILIWLDRNGKKRALDQTASSTITGT
jgi:MFS family permease